MTDATHWTRFWQQDGRTSCLPNADKIRRLIFDHWDEVAADLPQQAHVLDLGCGSGVLAERLADARADITVTGIDLADIKDSDKDRVTLKSGVDMAKLPFDDASVDAVVSLFGVEYADPEAFGPELARVMKPGATFCFVTHHGDSPVVADNQKRSDVLTSLTDKKVAMALADQDRDGLVRQMFDIRQFAGMHAPLVDEVARGLAGAFGQDKDAREAAWNEFAEKAEVELAILEAMNKAALADPRQWAARLGPDLAPRYPTQIVTPMHERIAWVIEGERALASG